MASSLTAECTPLKKEYDACFNGWFGVTLSPSIQAEQYEKNCGALWASYRDCVHRAVESKGLMQLLNDARSENHSTSPYHHPRNPPHLPDKSR
ncbi:hypothetical protein BKA62DRAFT_739298 [Auriculariales sp. MPI-PUGE-AT-0066]|nr:hypothetical protein BKA62DRAFT_739298 [Auriculariales sp. MPI-PUGE-AT-0066]